MAGAIPITVKPAEGDTLRRLDDVALGMFLTVLDELGWMPAREVLAGLAAHQQQTKHGEMNDDGTCAPAESVER